MNWNIRQRLNSENSVPTIACLFALLAIGLAVALSGGAAAAEPVNTTVDVGNDTGTIYAQATFNSTIDDANATADVVVTDPSGVEIANKTISGNASETVVEEWSIDDSDPTGNYSVVVTADDGVVDAAEAGTFMAGDGGGGGDSGGDSDGWGSYMGLPIWGIVIGGAAIVLLVGQRNGWWEDLR